MHPLGKEHITKGATMKTNGFPSTFNDWMPNPGSKQDRLFLQIVIEAINPPKQDFFFFPEEEYAEKCVNVLLDGEEAELVFIDHPNTEISVSFPCQKFLP